MERSPEEYGTIMRSSSLHGSKGGNEEEDGEEDGEEKEEEEEGVRQER